MPRTAILPPAPTHKPPPTGHPGPPRPPPKAEPCPHVLPPIQRRRSLPPSLRYDALLPSSRAPIMTATNAPLTARRWKGSWFRAQQRAYTIEMVLPRERGFYRDLMPRERALGAYILPPFQRPPVWSLEQKVRLIESFLDELPVPAYVVNRDLDPPYTHERWLLDGQQRITAVLEFVSGAFAVRGLRFQDVSERDQSWFLDRPFPCLETELKDEALLRDVYDRLAYGGTPHTPPTP